MHGFELLTNSLRILIPSLPLFIASGVGFVVVAARRTEGARSSTLALWGFGILFVIHLVGPISTFFLQRWVFLAEHPTDRLWTFPVTGFLFASVASAGYVFLLMAILAPRPAQHAVVPPPVDFR